MLSHCVGRPTRRGVIAIALMTPGPVSTIRGLLTDLSPVRRTDPQPTRVIGTISENAFESHGMPASVRMRCLSNNLVISSNGRNIVAARS